MDRFRVTPDEEKTMVVSPAQPVTVYYGPLKYYFIHSGPPERLQMRIINLSDEQIVLVGEWSSVTDTLGISHPLLNRVLAPHSYSGMTLPPEPRIYPPFQAWPGGMQARFEPMSGPSDGSPFYYWQNETFFGVKQPQFDWEWESGTARLRLEYETEGRSFEHDFVLVRERAW